MVIMILPLLHLSWVEDTAGKSRHRLRGPASLRLCPQLAAGRALYLRHFHRQAPSSIQEHLLTMPLHDQINQASTGLSSLGHEPRAPSPAHGLPSLSHLLLLRVAVCSTTGPSQSLTCLSRQFKLQPPSRSQSEGSLMHSRREFSRAISTWTDLSRL